MDVGVYFLFVSTNNSMQKQKMASNVIQFILLFQIALLIDHFMRKYRVLVINHGLKKLYLCGKNVRIFNC